MTVKLTELKIILFHNEVSTYSQQKLKTYNKRRQKTRGLNFELGCFSFYTDNIANPDKTERI